MIEHGSIEVVRGVGNNSTSEGILITPDDPLDDDNLNSEVARLTGVTINGGPQQHPYPENRCRGVFAGVDADGKHCKVKVWVAPFAEG